MDFVNTNEPTNSTALPPPPPPAPRDWLKEWMKKNGGTAGKVTMILESTDGNRITFTKGCCKNLYEINESTQWEATMNPARRFLDVPKKYHQYYAELQVTLGTGSKLGEKHLLGEKNNKHPEQGSFPEGRTNGGAPQELTQIMPAPACTSAVQSSTSDGRPAPPKRRRNRTTQIEIDIQDGNVFTTKTGPQILLKEGSKFKLPSKGEKGYDDNEDKMPIEKKKKNGPRRICSMMLSFECVAESSKRFNAKIEVNMFKGKKKTYTFYLNAGSSNIRNIEDLNRCYNGALTKEWSCSDYGNERLNVPIAIQTVGRRRLVERMLESEKRLAE